MLIKFRRNYMHLRYVTSHDHALCVMLRTYVCRYRHICGGGRAPWRVRTLLYTRKYKNQDFQTVNHSTCTCAHTVTICYKKHINRTFCSMPYITLDKVYFVDITGNVEHYERREIIIMKRNFLVKGI